MERDNFPKIDLLSRLAQVGRFLGRLVNMHQLSTHGDHDFGGGPALDRALYDQPQYEAKGSYYFVEDTQPEDPDLPPAA